MSCPSCGDERRVLKLGNRVILLPISLSIPIYQRMHMHTDSLVSWGFYCMSKGVARGLHSPHVEMSLNLLRRGATVVGCPDCTSFR